MHLWPGAYRRYWRYWRYWPEYLVACYLINCDFVTVRLLHVYIIMLLLYRLSTVFVLILEYICSATALYGCIERWRQRLVIVCFIINFVCDVRKHFSFCETRKRLVSPSCSFMLSLVAAMQVVHACVVVIIVYMCVNHSFRESHFVCVSTCVYVYANSAPFQQWSLSYKQGLKRTRPVCLS